MAHEKDSTRYSFLHPIMLEFGIVISLRIESH